jgi:RNA polymerase sigma-70 factor (ECF subfamily)
MSAPQEPKEGADRGAAAASATSLTLLQRARANEPGAWERLVGLYTPLVRHWCCAAGLQSADADDAVQEVLLCAAANLAAFRRDRPGDSFRAWLRTLTRNSLVSLLRRRARQPVAAGGTESRMKLQELADPQVELPDEDEAPQLQELYRRALELVRGEFEERSWQMFWLCVVEERPASEVGERFGVTAAAVRKAKSRVLHRLKQEVGDVID